MSSSAAVIDSVAKEKDFSSEESEAKTPENMTSVASTTQGNIWGCAAGNPWAKTSSPPACSLNDVMSEQLAQELQTSEELEVIKQLDGCGLDSEFTMGNAADTSDDLLIAQMMQHEFDKEHDHEIKLKESKFNADSKVKISYDNYRAVHPSLWDEYDDPQEEVVERAEVKEQQRNFRGRGISGKGKDIVTKHDAGLSQRRNASKITDQFPPEINVGDGHDLKLSNKVYNKLKIYSKAESKRAHKLHEKKDHSTAEHSMDPKTRLILYKLVNNGTLDDVSGIISTGKESVVFHAETGSDAVIPYENDSSRVQIPPPEVAIKVYKTTLTDFKNRADYVKGDVRFFKDEFKKQNPRKIMKLWADKESINLRRMARFGIPCPKVVLLRKHVLLMSFIGRNQVAAPKLKDAKLSAVDLQLAYEQIVESMKRMYRDCMLVHADLSEYNILWHDDTAYIIDVSQAVDRYHPHAHEFLLRDCRNISQFFTRSGVHNVSNEYQLFNDITGLELKGEGKEFLMQVEEYEKNENILRLGNSKKNYNFDFFFDRATKQREEDEKTANDDVTAETHGVGASSASRLEARTGEDDRLNTRDESEDGQIENQCVAGEFGSHDIQDDLSSSDEEADEETAIIFEKYLEERRKEIEKDHLESGSSSPQKVSRGDSKRDQEGCQS